MPAPSRRVLSLRPEAPRRARPHRHARRVAFEVDAVLVGQSVTLRYDPARTPNKRTVESGTKASAWRCARLDALSNCFVRRNKTRDALEVDGDITADVPKATRCAILDDGDEGGF